ncbi:hypothetical protein FLONG3_10864 [Fusarium longipes]|uniref:TeaA receptor TeaR n=1 Tax=Fusarium longipes TaxID=694270 RepID=A0A395RJU1_9HYPO|nr:hypothetical protein FLONG3_10864 [Fusarium longipes]
MAPAPTSTENITPPRSSHGQADSWGYNLSQKEDFDNDMNAVANHDFSSRNHFTTQNGNSNSYHSGMDRVGRKMNSHDNLSSAKLHNSVDGVGARHITESKTSPALNGSSWGEAYGPHETEDEYSRNAVPIDQSPDEGSKWIHRDKLARIESEELQAAGIYMPRARNHSKPRRGERDRSRSAMRRGTDTSETRSRKNSTAVDARSPETGGEAWDLRTPEEIAEEENNAYFHPNNHKGGSRIPVAKVSPVPISIDRFERASIASRKTSSSPENERTLTYEKTRPGSAHMMKASDAVSINSNLNSSLPAPKRTATENPSPKKNANGPRKTSAPSKAGTTGSRPKTRSGSVGNSISTTRPSTRSGELSPGNKAPEGDPPWMINSYKPDPRLPPDQQLLPTVARRLQQEKWEKEGKFGDVYDKDFRPLNDNALGREHNDHINRSGDETETKEKQENQPEGEWPLKLEPTKSPTHRAGGYSTMPKISDKPANSPLPSPRTPMSPNAPLSPTGPVQEQPKEEQSTEQPVQQQPPPQRQQPADDDSKGGCGCCVVM